MKATILVALLIGTSSLASSQAVYGAAVPFPPKVQTNGVQHFSNGITVKCGDTITTSVKLKQDIVCNDPLHLSTGIYIQASNIVLDCKGHSIKGIGNGLGNYYGIFSGSNMGVTIKNCNVEGFDIGLFIFHDSFDHLKNNKAISNNNYGFFSALGKFNRIESNEAQSTIAVGQLIASGGGFVEDSSGDMLVNDKSDSNAGYGFEDLTTGAGIGGTANRYFDNVCNQNTFGPSNPVGLC